MSTLVGLIVIYAWRNLLQANIVSHDANSLVPRGTQGFSLSRWEDNHVQTHPRAISGAF
jgi:hypothetical protein